MSACQDSIYFERSEDWQRVIGASFVAEHQYLDSYVPIGQVDLRVALDASFIVIVVQPGNPKETWRYGGEIRQAWEFPKGGETGVKFSTAQSSPTQMFINKPQAIRCNQNGMGKYRLLYDPPTWFKSVVVIGWVYTGDRENFVRDTLFDIGNKVGLDESLDTENLKTLLLEQRDAIAALEAKLLDISSESFNDEDIDIITEEVATSVNDIVQRNRTTIDRQLTNLTNAVNNLLPPEQQVDPNSQTSSQDNLEDEFI